MVHTQTALSKKIAEEIKLYLEVDKTVEAWCESNAGGNEDFSSDLSYRHLVMPIYLSLSLQMAARDRIKDK